MKLSCALVTNVDSPALIAEAERLGYHRAWLYDSPAITSDVWMALALAAERTSTIGLGPGVLVPSLRHPMTNAAAIATLAAIAPGRVAVAVGSGFTGRYTLGKRPLKWAVVEEYVDGAAGAAARRDRPMGRCAGPHAAHGWIRGRSPRRRRSADRSRRPEGDRGRRTRGRRRVRGRGAESGGGGAALLRCSSSARSSTPTTTCTASRSSPGPATGWPWCSTPCTSGTAQRPCAALPGGAEWVAAIDAIPPAERHLVTHEGHLVRLTAVDEEAVALAADLLPQFTFTGTAAQLRERAAEYEAGGVTELVYQPAGPESSANSPA